MQALKVSPLESAVHLNEWDIDDYAIDQAIASARSPISRDVFFMDVLAQKLRKALLDSIPGATNEDIPKYRANQSLIPTQGRTWYARYNKVRRWLTRFAPQIMTI